MTKSSMRKTKSSIVHSWNDARNTSLSLEDLVYVVCEDVDSSYSNSIFWALRAEDFELVVHRDISACEYHNAQTYYGDNLIRSLVKKYAHWDISSDPKKEAQRTFISCEMKCRDFNLQSKRTTPLGAVDDVATVILQSRRKIASILGEVPKIESLPFGFGPGAAFSIKRRTTAYEKLNGALDVTPEAARHAVKLLQSCPGWLSLHGIQPDDLSRIFDCLTIIPGDRLSFVPKTAVTDRPIAIGPTMNVLLQKGIGDFIRTKLMRTGLVLNTAQQKHRDLAKQASLDGSLATIDLQNASDMISWKAVLDLLPFDWFSLLDEIRSKNYLIEGSWYPYQKFSAMGNGYTFELESLIFYAISYCCVQYMGLNPRDVSVYGDDIIIPYEASELLYSALSSVGFTINKEKSFSSGPFRESCGGDFFNGISVRGFYCKNFMTLAELVRFRNYLYRTGQRYVLKKTWRLVRKHLKFCEEFLAGPDDGTDDHIVFDDYVAGRRYNFVSLQSSKRGIGRRWHPGRVYALYRVMHSSPVCPVSLASERKANAYEIIAGLYTGRRYTVNRSMLFRQFGNIIDSSPLQELPGDHLIVRLLKRR